MNTETDFEVQPGVTKSMLLSSFNWVCDASDWKNPIDKVVETSDARFTWLCMAVEFFTGARLDFHPVGEVGKIRVTCVGYRMGPAGP